VYGVYDGHATYDEGQGPILISLRSHSIQMYYHVYRISYTYSLAKVDSDVM
jgi:hypothetical protein